MKLEDFIERELNPNEGVIYYNNEYSELCYVIYNKTTGAEVERGGF